MGFLKLKSTEFVYFNGTSVTGPPLPKPRKGHCLLRYKNTLLLIGGEGGDNLNVNYTSTVWIFRADKNMQYIGNGPSMHFDRCHHSCGIFYSLRHNGNPLVVVADEANQSGTSEYWDFTVPGSQWTKTSKS